jgi:hypothetical protein
MDRAVSHTIFEARELGDSDYVRQNGAQGGQPDGLGDGTVAESEDSIGRPSGAFGHQTDGPIECATASPFDGGSDLGLAGPPLSRSPGHTVLFGPRSGFIALGDRDG